MKDFSIDDWFRHFHYLANDSQELREESHPTVTQRAEWTACMTEITSKACNKCGLFPASKAMQPKKEEGQKSRTKPIAPLKKKNVEYLQIDVLAFPVENAWSSPVAAIEIENRSKKSRVSPECGIQFALWKVLQVQCPFRAVIFKRNSREEAEGIIKKYAEEVISDLQNSGHQFTGETYIGVLLQDSVAGSTADTGNKPIDFFWSRLNPNTGTFNETGGEKGWQ
jgi:hypothetical protein